MECSCSIGADVDDYSTVLDERWVNARTLHNCYECGRQIVPGENYYREKALDNGSVRTLKTCCDCKSIRENLVSDFYWGEVRELVSDAIYYCDGEIPERCISKLTPGARDWICERIEACWDSDEDDQ